MKRKLIVLLISLFMAAANAQSLNGELDTMVLQHADSMRQCYIAQDYECFLKYSHPKVLKTMGGLGKALQRTREDYKALQEEGILVEDLKFGVPSKMINTGTELQCIIPQQIEMLMPAGRMTATTTLIAISEDNGKSWYFVDASRFDLPSMQRLLPSLSNELEFPLPQDPIFEPFEEEAP